MQEDCHTQSHPSGVSMGDKQLATAVASSFTWRLLNVQSIYIPFYTVIATYETSIQHTYIPMSVLTVTFAIVTVLSLLLYKWMAPGKAYKPLQFGALYPTPSLRKSSMEQGNTNQKKLISVIIIHSFQCNTSESEVVHCI